MSRFVPNPGLTAALERSAEYRAAMRAQAELVKRNADQTGDQIGLPWLPRDGEPETFVVAQDGTETAVVNTDHGGHWAEWGNVNVPPSAPLRRAARAAGLRLK